jgi:hypothetical protein
MQSKLPYYVISLHRSPVVQPLLTSFPWYSVESRLTILHGQYDGLCHNVRPLWHVLLGLIEPLNLLNDHVGFILHLGRCTLEFFSNTFHGFFEFSLLFAISY